MHESWLWPYCWECARRKKITAEWDVFPDIRGPETWEALKQEIQAARALGIPRDSSFLQDTQIERVERKLLELFPPTITTSPQGTNHNRLSTVAKRQEFTGSTNQSSLE